MNSPLYRFENNRTLSKTQAGKMRRMSRIFSSNSGRSVIVPLDDTLIFGPVGGLEQISVKIAQIVSQSPDAVLGFSGLFQNYPDLLSKTVWIVNLTASTSRSYHTRKISIGTVEEAIKLGADAVAVHVNISSKYETEMLQIFGSIAKECENFAMPLLAIMYPRSESEIGDNNFDELKNSDRKEYAKLISHAARVGVDLGADIIKTKYTGDPESFHTVVEACLPVPIVVAGGPALPFNSMVQMAYEIVSAGGAGVSFGRNIFSRPDPHMFVVALKAIVHEGAAPEEVIASFEKMSQQGIINT